MAIMEAAFRRRQTDASDQHRSQADARLDEAALTEALAAVYSRKPKLQQPPARRAPAPEPALDSDDAPPLSVGSSPPAVAGTEAGLEVALSAMGRPATQASAMPADQLAWLERARRRRWQRGLNQAAAWTTVVIVVTGIAGLVALLLFGLPPGVAERLGLDKPPSVSAAPARTTSR